MLGYECGLLGSRSNRGAVMAGSEHADRLTGKTKTDVPAGTSNSAPVTSADRLSASLRYYLAKRRLTQEQLAQRLGWQQSRISDIMNQRILVSIGTLDKLAKALHVSSIKLLMPIKEKHKLPYLQTVITDIH